MSDLEPQIRSAGEQYFTSADIKAFVDHIKRLAPDPVANFFQIVQRGDAIELEFGALTKAALVDVTMTPDETRVVIIRRGAVSLVHLRIARNEEGGAADLSIAAEGANSALTYTASKEAADRLIEYASKVQTEIGRGGSEA